VYRIANETSSNLRAIFGNTATRRGISPAIIEKDVWVCFLLEVLFHQSKYSKNFAFKGGTVLPSDQRVHALKRSAVLQSVQRFLNARSHTGALRDDKMSGFWGRDYRDDVLSSR